VGVVANYASGVRSRRSWVRLREGSVGDRTREADWAPGFSASNVIIGSPDNWYNANAFVLPPAGEYGNVGRNTLRGPDLRMVDLSIFKNTLVARRNVQFRFEIFNLFNRDNFATPVTDGLFSVDGTRIPSATRITHTATTSRQLQLGLKFVF
jgi:hypothetical protein